VRCGCRLRPSLGHSASVRHRKTNAERSMPSRRQQQSTPIAPVLAGVSNAAALGCHDDSQQPRQCGGPVRTSSWPVRSRGENPAPINTSSAVALHTRSPSCCATASLLSTNASIGTASPCQQLRIWRPRQHLHGQVLLPAQHEAIMPSSSSGAVPTHTRLLIR
jgi:hypothetical protein